MKPHQCDAPGCGEAAICHLLIEVEGDPIIETWLCEPHMLGSMARHVPLEELPREASERIGADWRLLRALAGEERDHA